MEYRSSNSREHDYTADHHHHQTSHMSILAMPAPSYPRQSAHTNGWGGWQSEDRQAADVASQTQSSRNGDARALPSITELVPELLYPDSQQRSPASQHSAGPYGQARTTSSPSNMAAAGMSEYVHSSLNGYKRQRLAGADERGEPFSQVPRLCIEQGASPSTAPMSSAVPSASSSPLISSASSTTPNSSVATDGWPSSGRITHHGNGSSSGSISSSSGIRQSLPSLPPMRYEEPAPTSRAQQAQGYPSEAQSSGNYGYSSHQGSHHHHHHQPSYTYGDSGRSHSHSQVQQEQSYDDYHHQHHPSRMQSMSGGSVYGYDKATVPTSVNGSRYGPQQSGYHQPRDYMEYGGSISRAASSIGNSSPVDTKQRKRRGNLPKATTDILRAWFVDHLTHPYPSEDEKQEFMRQTGLQMNQISNWFINARRRHLPGLINNAQTEVDISSRRGSNAGLVNNMGSMSDVHHYQSVQHRGRHSDHSEHSTHGSHGIHGSHTNHRMYASPEHAESRQSSAYMNSSRSSRRGQDFDDLPSRPKHMKRGSV